MRRSASIDFNRHQSIRDAQLTASITDQQKRLVENTRHRCPGIHIDKASGVRTTDTVPTFRSNLNAQSIARRCRLGGGTCIRLTVIVVGRVDAGLYGVVSWMKRLLQEIAVRRALRWVVAVVVMGVGRHMVMVSVGFVV